MPIDWEDAIPDKTVRKIEELYERRATKRRRLNVRAFTYARCEAKISHLQLDIQERLGIIPKGSLPNQYINSTIHFIYIYK